MVIIPLYRGFASFVPVSQEISPTKLEDFQRGQIDESSHIQPIILEYTGPTFTSISGLVGRHVESDD